jgi:hypothetical protein
MTDAIEAIHRGADHRKAYAAVTTIAGRRHRGLDH